MPQPLYPHKREPVPHSSGAWVCLRAQNLVPHWKYTRDHKYLFCDAPPTRGPSKPSSRKVSRRNTFIIYAVQDVYMYSQNTLPFKILLKCIKCRLTFLCIQHQNTMTMKQCNKKAFTTNTKLLTHMAEQEATYHSVYKNTVSV